MAPRHAFTVQLVDRNLLDDNSPGHAATVISTPQQQVYAGLGPAYHDWRHLWGAYSPPSFSPQVVSREETPPRFNYSTAVSSHSPYATYTIPITENQANQALAEIRRREASDDWFNVSPAVRNYCTADVNRNATAMGLGAVLPYETPGSNRDYFANVERTLRANPRAKFVVDEQGRPMLDSAGIPTTIPESLREIQQDYAFVGGGYDTPSERLGRVPSQSGPPNPHKWRSGDAPLNLPKQPETTRRRRRRYAPFRAEPDISFVRPKTIDLKRATCRIRLMSASVTGRLHLQASARVIQTCRCRNPAGPSAL